MKFYLAPMEGITGYIYRQAYNSCFKPMDRYFTPFLAPKHKSGFSSKELNDILPEHNQGLCLIPQILTHSAEDFLWVCEELAEYGYRTVNLNLGCPSGTVVTKKKGAGFLAEPEDLSLFLEEVCNGLEKIHAADGKPVRLSIKTRIGMKEASEFPRLLAIYNHYPLEELIVHPRVREDYYKGKIRMESFAYALEQSRCSVSYNGNLFSAADASALMEEIVGQDEPSDKGEMQKKTKLAALMVGRGAVARPWIFGEVWNLPSSTHLQSFQQFHDRLLTGYAEIMSGDRNTLFKMKELWYYFQCHFPGCEKELKRIKKAQMLFRRCLRAGGLWKMVFATRHYRSDTGLSCNHPLIQAVQCCEYQILHRFYIIPVKHFTFP